MAKARGDFTDILLRKKILGPDQLDEAESIASRTGVKLQDALVKLDYATAARGDDAPSPSTTACSSSTWPRWRSRRRSSNSCPSRSPAKTSSCRSSLEGNALKIITADPTDYDTIQKLQFILNKDIQPVLAVQEQIIEAINRHYGQTRNRVGGLDARRVHRHRDRLHRRPRRSRRMAAADDSDAPVVKLCNLIIQEAVSLRASRTSTSSRSPTASASATGSTASWSSATPPRGGCSPRCSPVSRSWGPSTSPRSAGRRTAGSR